MIPGEKAEAWETTLGESTITVNLCYDILLKMGKRPFIIERMKDRPDEGDVLIFSWAPDPNNHAVYGIRHVDVKRNANWGEGDFPFPTVYLTANNQLHKDWLYVVFNNSATRVGFIDMRKVDGKDIGSDETLNRRGGGQNSQYVPTKYMKQYDVSRWINDHS